MRGRHHYIVFAVMFLMGIGSNALAVRERGNEKSSVLSTTLGDQKGVAVTIYNVNLGLVKDQREIKLPLGIRELKFMDVACVVSHSNVALRLYLKYSVDSNCSVGIFFSTISNSLRS